VAKSKRTYFTKADLQDYGRYLHSDERRAKKQIEARAKLEAGVINFIPWSIAERIVTDDDLKDWLEIKNRNNEKKK